MSTLFSFKKPPLVEAILGIHFSDPFDIEGLDFFIFQEQLGRAKFLHSSEQPYLVLSPSDHANPSISINISNKLRPQRYWFESEDRVHLYQLQNDKLIYNWRKQTNSDLYPRFPDSIEKLFEGYAALMSVLKNKQQNITDKIKPASNAILETTYVNRIKIEHLNQLNNIFKVLGDLSSVSPEFILIKCYNAYEFTIPDISAKMVIQISPIKNRETGDLEVDLTITLMGPVEVPHSTNPINVYTSWFERAREHVVSTFGNITTKEMHNLWEME